MKEKDLPFIDDIAMFREEPIDPMTKEPIKKSEKLNCFIDTKYGTGMIICNDKNSNPRIFPMIVLLTIGVIACVILFSFKIEIKNLEEIPFINFLILNPFAFLIIIGIIVTIIGLIKKMK